MRRRMIFNSTTGLNNKVDPVRLQNDKGLTELASAMNVDIDQTGRLSRRLGYSLVTSGKVHSFFDCGTTCLCVDDGYLKSFTGAALLSISQVGSSPMGYAKVFMGDKDVVYMGNGSRALKHNVGSYSVSNWEFTQTQNVNPKNSERPSEYVGPETSRFFQSVPVPSVVEVYNGRMYAANGENVWVSEPFAYDMFDLARGYLPFKSRVKMIKSVMTGLYVGDEDSIYFLHGSGPKDFTVTEVHRSPVIPGTDTSVDAGIFDLYGKAVLMATKEGVCLGGMDGYFKNLSEKKIRMPDASSGSAIIINNRVVFSFKKQEVICL